MSFKLLGVSGRVGRGTWWLVQIVTIVIGTIINFTLNPFNGIDLQNQAEVERLMADKNAMMTLGRQLLTVTPVYFLSFILSHWFFITSSVQRLHDRGSSGWRVLFAYVPMMLFIVAISLVFSQSYWLAGTLALMGLAGTLVSFVWMIIEFGMLSGEDCENDYGEPPNASSRKAQLQAELNALRGETAPDPVANYAVRPMATPQPALSFASGPSKPVFGKR